MSFECKYKNNDFCELRRKECTPGAEGCVLNGRAQFIKPPEIDIDIDKNKRRR
jgi:hypothetical protein